MKRILVLAAAAISLAACAEYDPQKPMSPDFGNAVRADIAAQVVNPRPAMGGTTATDGHVTFNAMRRYETGSVIPPRPDSGTVFDTSTSPTAPAMPSQGQGQ